MYGECYWVFNGKEVPYYKFSSQRLEMAARSEGSILSRSQPFRQHATPGTHTPWEQTASWDSTVTVRCKPAPTGSNCVLLVNGESQKWYPTGNELLMAQSCSKEAP